MWKVKGLSVYHWVMSHVVGYDVFIAYRNADARAYAQALHAALEKRGLTVYLDEADGGAGANIRDFVRRACASRCLVVVVTPGIYKSQFVCDEVDGYRARRLRSWWRRPFSRLIPINVDQALSEAPNETEAWALLRESVFVKEAADAVFLGAPSQEVIDQIRRSGRFVRSAVAFSIAVGVTVLIVGALLAASVLGLISVNQTLITAREDLTALRTERSQLINSNEALTNEGESLRLRNAAIRNMAVDKTLAYRQAEAAEKILPAEENREVIRSIVSSNAIFYDRVIVGCTISDTSESSALLLCGNKPSDRFLTMLSLKDRSETRLLLPAGEDNWIIPVGDSWRLLRLGERDNQKEYELFEPNGAKVGTSVLGRLISLPDVRCGSTSAFVWTSGLSGTSWDLLGDQRVPIHVADDADMLIDPYEMLDCRGDGSKAIYHVAGKLLLTDKDGKLVGSSQTSAEFDPFYADGAWSSDGNYYAILQTDRHSLGIWNPASASFTNFDPAKSHVTAFAWARSAKMIAYAANTFGAADASIMIVSPANPHAVIREISGDRRVRSITFSPDEAQVAFLDDEGTLKISAAAENSIIAVGQHRGAQRVFWIGDALLTSSQNDTRVWSLSAPLRARWTFKSHKSRVYVACSASDPASRWIAAAAISDQDSSAFTVVVRDPVSGKDRELQPVKLDLLACKGMASAENGKWLLVMGLLQTYFWNTESWDLYKIDLDQQDRQFFTIRESNGNTQLIATKGSIGDSTYHSYLIKFDSGRGPLVDSRAEIDLSTSAPTCPQDEVSETIGWQDAFERTQYTSAGKQRCDGSEWQVRTWCRTPALIGQDCDIDFVPLDFRWLLSLYDRHIYSSGDSMPGEGDSMPGEDKKMDVEGASHN